MKKSFLLSFCLLSIYGISACSSVTTNQEEVYFVTEEDSEEYNKSSTNPYSDCGANGVSCNDSALVNYSKTDANYRMYGERTKNSHLYTQSGTGNNLTSTIVPGIEEERISEVIKPVVPEEKKSKKGPKFVIEDGVFSETKTLDIETDNKDYQKDPLAIKKSNNSMDDAITEDKKELKGISSNIIAKKDNMENEITIADNLDTQALDSGIKNSEMPKVKKMYDIEEVVKEDGSIVRIRKIVELNGDISEIKKVTDKNGNITELKKTVTSGKDVYEIECEEDCELFLDEESDESDIVLSEFTEESFNIEDYIEDEDIKFESIGSKEIDSSDVNITEVTIDDNTVMTWEAVEGDNLRELLTKWSKMSGWKLLWNTNRNYILDAGVMFKGKFADVSSALIRAFARARPAPIATYYKGNRVIVIETMENENAY